jgi:hypothetical protein
VRIVEGELELAGDDLKLVTAVVARLSAAGAVSACETRRPTLEERFLALTGDGARP